ncbi:hypothetical protein [Microbacterium binotii]|uniref:XRE family transcriptional regulator n=1 Tax=Microbacterium binotii TaxID=462710 RepID=A0ABN3PGH7_9MICO
MGNERSDAVRAELKSRLDDKYGDLKAAAAALGVPHKTLYRNLTTKGKDRTATVSLEFIMDAVEHLHSLGGDDFATFYAAALRRVH